MFDADLILAAGNTGTYDWDKACLDAYGEPTSTTRNDGGFAVLDLKGTPANGLAIVFIGKDSSITADDALVLTVESSENEDFASVVHELAEFDLAAVASGTIVGSEFPLVVVRRIATGDRYLRCKATCAAGDALGECWVLVAPWPFKTL